MEEKKQFNGKAIYKPKGKAGEYSEWACNFYVGCSNRCTYCYCKKGRGAKIMGGDVPTLKKCFKNEEHALQLFEKELKANLPELQKHGLFFSFTTDPMLPETIELTEDAIGIAKFNNVPCKILTKCTNWVNDVIKDWNEYKDHNQNLIAYGFTLTGHDELEPGASTNAERIEAMKKLHDAGFKTFASIEPIIDFASSRKMIFSTLEFCDLYKIGLMSGVKYMKITTQNFMYGIMELIDLKGFNNKLYFKDSIINQSGMERSELYANCVNRDYNMFQ